MDFINSASLITVFKLYIDFSRSNLVYLDFYFFDVGGDPEQISRHSWFMMNVVCRILAGAQRG